jgi:hypothetical protein
MARAVKANSATDNSMAEAFVYFLLAIVMKANSAIITVMVKAFSPTAMALV